MELDKKEMLYFATAYKKKVDKEWKALKAECDAEFLDEYRESGNTQKRSLFFGKGAGTYYIPIKEAQPPEEIANYEVSDDEKLAEWLDANPDAATRYALLNAQDFARFWFNFTGECPEGIKRGSYTTDGVPETPGTPTMKVKEDVVFEKMQEMGLLAEGTRLFLGGADD